MLRAFNVIKWLADELAFSQNVHVFHCQYFIAHPHVCRHGTTPFVFLKTGNQMPGSLSTQHTSQCDGFGIIKEKIMMGIPTNSFKNIFNFLGQPTNLEGSFIASSSNEGFRGF